MNTTTAQDFEEIMTARGNAKDRRLMMKKAVEKGETQLEMANGRLSSFYPYLKFDDGSVIVKCNGRWCSMVYGSKLIGKPNAAILKKPAAA